MDLVDFYNLIGTYYIVSKTKIIKAARAIYGRGAGLMTIFPNLGRIIVQRRAAKGRGACSHRRIFP
jgi:hypothetical protein